MTLRLRRFLYLDDTLVSAFSRQLDAAGDETRSLSPDVHDLSVMAFQRLYDRISATGPIDQISTSLALNAVIEAPVLLEHSPLARAIGMADAFADIQTMLDLFTKTKTIRKHDAYFASIRYLQKLQHAQGVPLILRPHAPSGVTFGGTIQKASLRVPLADLAGTCTALLTVQRPLAAGEMIDLFDRGPRNDRKAKMKAIPAAFQMPLRAPGALVNVVALYR